MKKYLSADREATIQELGDISQFLVLPQLQASTWVLKITNGTKSVFRLEYFQKNPSNSEGEIVKD